MNTPKRSDAQRGLRSHSTGFALLLIATLILAGLSACGSATSTTQSSSSGKSTVTIGYMDNGAEPEVIAVAKSYFNNASTPMYRLNTLILALLLSVQLPLVPCKL